MWPISLIRGIFLLLNISLINKMEGNISYSKNDACRLPPLPHIIVPHQTLSRASPCTRNTGLYNILEAKISLQSTVWLTGVGQSNKTFYYNFKIKNMKNIILRIYFHSLWYNFPRMINRVIMNDYEWLHKYLR